MIEMMELDNPTITKETIDELCERIYRIRDARKQIVSTLKYAVSPEKVKRRDSPLDILYKNILGELILISKNENIPADIRNYANEKLNSIRQNLACTNPLQQDGMLGKVQKKVPENGCNVKIRRPMKRTLG